MWWNIIYFDKHNGIVPFFPDFIIRLFVSIFICNFAGEIMNCVAHYLHLATFRFYYCSCTSIERNSKDKETHYKAKDAVGDDEAKNGSANSTGCPGDVATLKPHKFEGLLQSLEHGITDVLSIVVYC